ncbi:hypothetical protein EJ06DRAFT_277944 [Trichodelitschia bisporula]|uniref:Uncharacterized protein n=1 Tax=Trichodelitschia bisporula TaxID=703511 RepID=A0A6G1I5I1_9PEZI|nr:hypothetical protein EJ06DRAFT_277944 [Trichodelitschia bisporula]
MIALLHSAVFHSHNEPDHCGKIVPHARLFLLQGKVHSKSAWDPLYPSTPLPRLLQYQHYSLPPVRQEYYIPSSPLLYPPKYPTAAAHGKACETHLPSFPPSARITVRLPARCRTCWAATDVAVGSIEVELPGNHNTLPNHDSQLTNPCLFYLALPHWTTC